MRYSRSFLEAIGYELAPVVVTSRELEDRLAPLYERLHLAPGQLEALTGIVERRWWDEGASLSLGATAAARKALAKSNVQAKDVEVLVYAGVCREDFEPATACHVAAELRVSEAAAVYDVSNACLGVLNGILEVANRIELGHVRAGLVVTCETAREINDLTIGRLLANPHMELLTRCFATFTGGSGAAAVLLTDGSFANSAVPRLLGAVHYNAPEHHRLCRWGIDNPGIDNPESAGFEPTMSTDSAAVLKHGVELGVRTWGAFLDRLRWRGEDVDKVICHQVGSAHQETILEALEIPAERDFSTYEFLGNMGTVSLPLTAALAEEREFLKPGDRVGFLGIGSGLNCMMLGWQW